MAERVAPQAIEKERLQKGLEAVLGRVLAQRARVLALEGGVLELVCDHPAVKAEIQGREKDLVEAIDGVEGVSVR